MAKKENALLLDNAQVLVFSHTPEIFFKNVTSKNNQNTLP